MLAKSSVLLLLCAAPVMAMLRGTGHHTSVLGTDMRPEVVSQLLANVEKKWKQSCVMVLRNVTDETSAFASMKTSCVKVATAVVQGSEGDKDRVVEYMRDVCSAENAKDNEAMCSEFASGVEAAMTDDQSYNRDQLDLGQFCQKFWDGAVKTSGQEEKKRLDEEEAKREEAEKKRAEAEEEERKRKEEAAQKQAQQVANQTVTNKSIAAASVPVVQEQKVNATAAVQRVVNASATDVNVSASVEQPDAKVSAASPATTTTNASASTADNATASVSPQKNITVLAAQTIQNKTAESKAPKVEKKA